jgi:UDP-2,3-diacylglucosamine hydrolase
MRALVLSDVHYRDPSGDAEQAVVALLDAAQMDELWLLGDIFDVWWGFRRVVPVAAVPLCAALLRVRDRGVRVRALAGNRDFSWGPFFTRELAVAPLPSAVFAVDGRRVRLGHGDEADRTLGYRLARRCLRGRAVAVGLWALGPDRALGVLGRLADGSRAASAPASPLVAAQREWAAAALRDGADVVMMGHSHHRAHERSAAGEVVWLGDWPHHRSGAWWEDGAVRPFPGGR